MHLLTVTPIVRGVPKDTLTYFSKDSLPLGSVISVPLRTREVPALVTEIQEVANAKSTIKSSRYALRKILHPKPVEVWNKAFIASAFETARFHLQGPGETLLALTPSVILDAYLSGKIDKPLPSITVQEKTISAQEGWSSPRSILAIQNDTTTRLESYQRLVREAFVRHESTFICVPTERDVERVARIVGHGIEDYVFLFHNGLTKKCLIERWNTATRNEHAILVIGTPQYLALDRHFATIVIDEEHARGWKTLMRPLIDMRIFAEQYARLTGSTLILGASLLRAETHKRLSDGTIGEFARIAAHAPKNIRTELIDPRREEKDLKEKNGKRTVQLLSEQVRATIAELQEKNGHMVLISARKGLSPITLCEDCGTVVRCPNCENPLVLHKKNDVRIFSCHACGFVRIPEEGEHETCPSCGGWRLGALGIGTERVEEEVKKLFPHVPRFLFDGDHITTRTQAQKCIARLESSPNGILIATPMVVPYLSAVDHIAVISIDSLFAIPDFRINEHMFTLVLALREKAEKSLLIQTRADDTTLLTQALTGDLASFIESELALRKTFLYPPYSTIIKITLRGTREELPAKIKKLKMFLAPLEPLAPNTATKESKNIFRMHLILKLKIWPDEKLSAKLRTLPPEIAVDVNPDHLL